jgi:hypothetical protein
MKFIYLLLLLTIVNSSILAEGHLYFPKQTISIDSQDEIKSYLKNYFNEIHHEDFQLTLRSCKATKHIVHFTYSLVYKQIPILNSTIKLSTDRSGRVYSIKKELNALDYLPYFNMETALKNWNAFDLNKWLQQQNIEINDVKSTQLKISLESMKPSIVLEVNQWNKVKDITSIYEIDGTKLLEYNHSRNLNIDTVVNARIFNPDPITTLGLIYGGVYVDSADRHLDWMLPTYNQVTLPVTFDNLNNTFYLENSLVKVDEFESPVIDPVTSLSDQFLFYRNQSGFEDCNAVYHITKFHDYISSIGYDTLMKLQLLIDTHGQFGGDNSVFNRNGGNPTISFGTGGVDDAEDADVIIHEYCHGISWSANDNANFTFERSGLDEGLADYFATSYSRAINPYSWQRMFTWDGHNEFWSGRRANSFASYPSTGNIYAVGEIWNGAMSAIWTDLGNIVTDKLMLESLHFFTDQTTLPEAAMYLLQADSILFNGVHVPIICSHFQHRNLLMGNCIAVGFHDFDRDRNEFKVINSLGFAKNESDLRIQFNESKSGKWILYSLLGEVIKSTDFNTTESFVISPKGLNSGIYFLQIQLPEGTQTIKLSSQ